MSVNGMHPDLRWLAENVSEWASKENLSMVRKSPVGAEFYDPEYRPYDDGHTKHQWLQARKDLGLIMSDEEMEIPAEAAGSVPEGAEKYRDYYKDVRHIEYIDVYRTVDLFGCEKHGHPISHAAKKLLLSGCRTGGKDVEEDVREAIDTLHRWLEMREEDKVNDR